MEPCNEIFQISIDCDISNLMTMIIELSIALGAGFVLAYFFYKRQKKEAQELLQLRTEQEELKRRMRQEFSINRIRSNLSAIHSIYQILLKQTSPMVTDEIKSHIAQKDELVESTQTATDQAADVLEADWILRINDICSLAKKHPWLLGHEDRIQTMQCEHLQGINSQIDELLKLMPNPPV